MLFLVPVVIGQREAAINVAEGKKQSQILASEARKMEQINIATGNQLHLLPLMHLWDVWAVCCWYFRGFSLVKPKKMMGNEN